jgi:hypothetical protein
VNYNVETRCALLYLVIVYLCYIGKAIKIIRCGEAFSPVMFVVVRLLTYPITLAVASGITNLTEIVRT